MKADRQEKLLDFINTKPCTTYSEIGREFPDSSLMTLRRDVEELEKDGRVVRVRGGVKSINYVMRSADATFYDRLQENKEEKKRIARAALRLVNPGQVLFFDSGTTVFRMAEVMRDTNCWIYTSGLTTATALLKKQSVRVNIIGGLVSPDNITSSGEDALEMVGKTSFDIAFIVPSGVTASGGFTCGNYHFAELKRLASSRSKRTVLLFDEAKINADFPFHLFDFSEVSDVITSCRSIPEDIRAELSKAGVNVIVT